MSATWWLKKPAYFFFVLRDVTCVFIAGFLVLFLLQLASLGQGEEAYNRFIDRTTGPGWIIAHAIFLFFALYHSVTWFLLTGKIMVVRLGKKPIPAALLTLSSFAGWAVVSLLVGWFLVKGWQ